MKPEELRIGNLVMYDNRIFKIETIAKEFPTLDTDEFGIGVVDWNNIKPIPLTEDWLEKFGFEWDEKHDIYYLHPLALPEDLCFIFNYPSNIEVKSVHQLQNLYHALTGVELQLK